MKKEQALYTSDIRLAFLIICIAISLSAIGQVREAKNAPSPEVSSLGTFGSIPVGHYTGTPDISVPLYTLTSGKLSIPILARYHTSNVKPHAVPSCLGIGWALSAGGYIARNVKMVHDEKQNGTVTSGYYFNHTKVSQIGNSPNKSQALTNYTRLSGNNWYELSADEFSFNFNGYNGTFFMDKDGQWTVISDDHIAVEFDEQTGCKTFAEMRQRFAMLNLSSNQSKKFYDKFTLITPDGSRYEFGGGNATEYSVPYYNQVDGDVVATSWRLSKITTIDQRTVTFEYAADSYICDIHYTPQKILYYVDNAGIGGTSNYGRSGYSGFLMMPSRLTKITCGDETISLSYHRQEHYGRYFFGDLRYLYWNEQKLSYTRFQYLSNNSWSEYRFSLLLGIAPHDYTNESSVREAIADKITHDYLSGIAIQKPDGNALHIDFYYKETNHRKLLSGICFVSKKLSSLDDNTVDPGIPIIDPGFTYIESVNPANSVNGEIIGTPVTPGANDSKSTETVHSQVEYQYNFDYYPGLLPDESWPQNTSTIYTDSWGYFSKSNGTGIWQDLIDYAPSDYQVRPASLFDTRMYVLKSVTYPTGGKTVFDYELNDYSKEFDRHTASVSQVSGTAGGLRVKSVKNYDSSETLLYSKNYIYKHELDGSSSGVSKGRPCFYERLYFTGDHADYIDFYSIDDINPYPLGFNTPAVGYSVVFEELRDADDQLLTRTKYQYANYDTDINNHTHMDQLADYTANVYGQYACASFTSMAFERGKLLSREVMNAANMVLEKKTYEYVRTEGTPYYTADQEFYNMNGRSLEMSYLYKTYANQYLVAVNRRQEAADNGVCHSETHYGYYDYGLPRQETVISHSGDRRRTSYKYSFDEYPWMRDKHILVPVEITDSTSNGTETLQYTYEPSTLGVPYVTQQQTMRRLAQSNVIRRRTDYTVERADPYGNPVIWKEQEVTTVLIWSYQGRRLIASIQNASYDEVMNALGKTPEYYSELNSPPSLESLRAKLGKAHVSTYKYDSHLNLVSKTEPNGLSYIYEYDSLDRLTAEYRKGGINKELLHTYKYNYRNK